MHGNLLTTLPEGMLSGLTSLTTLNLESNRLTTLPDSIFAGLTGMTRLAMGGNAADPLPLDVFLEKTGEGQFKAVAPTGSPFEIVLPLIRVRNGRHQRLAQPRVTISRWQALKVRRSP